MKAAIYSRVSTDQQDYSKQTDELIVVPLKSKRVL